MKIVRAHRAIALGAWLTMTAVAVGPASGDPPSLLAIATRTPAATPSRESASSGPVAGSLDGLDLRGLLRGLPPAAVDTSWLSLTAAVSDRGANDPRTLLETGGRWHLVQFGAVANPHPVGARMTAFGELPYIAEDLDGGTAGPGEEAPEPASLGIKGEAGGFEVGAEYRSVGRRLERVVRTTPAAMKDRRGREVWIAQRLGLVRVRLSQSRLSDNVDRNPALPRTTEHQTAVGAELSTPWGPVLGLTYAVGDAERGLLTPEGRTQAPERHEFERVTGSTYYGSEWWEVAASSTYSQARDTLRPDAETVITSHDLSLSLRPVAGATVVPALSLWRARDDWSAVRSDAGSASLTLTYAPPRSRWSASSLVGYTTTRTSDAAVDGQALSVSAAVGCGLGRLLVVPSTLSVEVGYDRYLDAVVRDHSSAAASVFLLLTVATH